MNMKKYCLIIVVYLIIVIVIEKFGLYIVIYLGNNNLRFTYHFNIP